MRTTVTHLGVFLFLCGVFGVLYFATTVASATVRRDLQDATIPWSARFALAGIVLMVAGTFLLILGSNR